MFLLCISLFGKQANKEIYRGQTRIQLSKQNIFQRLHFKQSRLSKFDCSRLVCNCVGLRLISYGKKIRCDTLTEGKQPQSNK